MLIESSAPTRVDLAGGTIDIWPLYLFHPGAATVNFATSLRAHCQIKTRDDGRIVLESRDRKVAFETELAAIEDLVREERLELISKLVHFFKPTTGFHLTANSEAPAGAGMGGSSALAIACIGALNRLVGNRYDERKFITIAANIETTVIRVPAGFQDYYSAQYGAASCIHFRADGIEREALKIDETKLEGRRSRSATPASRAFREPTTGRFSSVTLTATRNSFELFDGIRDSALRMRGALLADDWNEVSETMRAGYPNRKRLAPGVTTPQMERLVEKALANGAEAAKVCGAGGGGCIAFLCAEGRKADVERALNGEEGAEVLDWKFSREGLIVTES